MTPVPAAAPDESRAAALPAGSATNFIGSPVS